MCFFAQFELISEAIGISYQFIITILFAKQESNKQIQIKMRKIVSILLKPKSSSFNLATIQLHNKPIGYSFVIGRIFKKKKDQQQRMKKVQQQKSGKQEEDPQDQIDLFYRRQQVQSDVDFQKIRKQQTTFIPEDAGRGGFDQLVYWSQTTKTPQQIADLLQKFCNQKVPENIQSPHHFQQFKSKVISTVSLAKDVSSLHNYTIFGYKFQIQDDYFWKNIQEKIIRSSSHSENDLKICINIVFLMSKMKKGQLIYNQLQQLLKEKTGQLQLQQIGKLTSAYFIMKAGSKQWVQTLFKKLFQNILTLDKDILTQIIPALMEYKGVQSQHYLKIEQRIMEIIDTLDFKSICEICPLFGHIRGSQAMWKALEEKMVDRMNQMFDERIKEKSIKIEKNQGQRVLSLTTMQIYDLAIGVLTGYKFSTEFVTKYLVPNLEKNNCQVLNQFSPQTLATISKILYIYQLEQKTAHIQKRIEIRIMDDFRNLDNAHPWALINVIKDYTVTRHASRQLFKFLQQVVRATMPDIKQDREALESLVVIYEHSGLCSAQTLTQIQALL